MPTVDPYDLEDVSTARVLASYSAIKGWKTRELTKLNSLTKLQSTAYSMHTEKEMVKTLADLERHIDALNAIAAHLKSVEYEKHEEHTKEAQAFADELKGITLEVVNITHQYNAKHANKPQDGNTTNVQQGPRASVFSDIRPDVLSASSSMAVFRRWKESFTRYYESSNMKFLSTPTQQELFLKVVDSEIETTLSCLITDTTTVLADARQGVVTCFSHLDNFFRLRNPLIARRRAFFAYRQKPGQSIFQVMKDLNVLATDADIANLTGQDSLCLMYMLAVSDDSLRDRLGEEPDPDIDKFKAILTAYGNRQITSREFGNSASAHRVGPPSKQRGGQGGNRPPRLQLSDAEKARRKSIKGRCFRCGGSDHMMPACRHPSSVVCNSCKQVGHMSAVCGKSAARTVSGQQGGQAQPQQQPQQQSTLPALEYCPEQSQSFYAGQAFGTSSPYNLPTPAVPL